jgi:toxin ParE1/3/4
LKLAWTLQALHDKDRIWLFHADRDVAYADRVEARIDARAAMLERFPWIGRPVPGRDLRELSIPDVQYLIAYRIEGEIVRILRIWSTAQGPAREGDL